MIDGIRPPRRPPATFPNRTANKPSDQFKPPEVVADEEEQQAIKATAGKLLPARTGKRKGGGWYRNLSRKQKTIFGAMTAVLAIAILAGAYALFSKGPLPISVPIIEKHKEEAPKPTTVASNLTGLQVEPTVNDRPVTAIMIENSLDARPQSGLDQAGVVFEAVAEGGITRFVTLFQDNEPEYIGPVRSVRPYYIQWAMGFDAAIAHAGGSTEALSSLTKWGAKDLNHASAYFWRVNSRAAPHNLYTSIAKLHEYESKKGYGKADYTSLTRKAEAPNTTPTAKTIDFNVSSTNFNPHYDYDAATNSYKRSEGGKAHTDEKSGAQLAPRVVVALIMPQGKNGQYTTYATIGSGQAFVFQDGVVTTGSWKKDSNEANIKLTDSNGAALALNPGQTWFTVLGGADRVAYTP